MSAVYRRCRDLRYRLLGQECVAIRQEAAEVLVLNATAGRVLDLVDGRRTPLQIAREIGREFDAGGRDFEAEVEAFVTELAAAGLLEAVQGAG